MARYLLLLAIILATSDAYHFLSGYERGHDEREVNRFNAQRQFRVNYIARSLGTGTGTSQRDGVPGTPYGVTGYGYHGNKANYGYGHFGGYGNKVSHVYGGYGGFTDYRGY